MTKRVAILTHNNDLYFFPKIDLFDNRIDVWYIDNFFSEFPKHQEKFEAVFYINSGIENPSCYVIPKSIEYIDLWIKLYKENNKEKLVSFSLENYEINYDCVEGFNIELCREIISKLEALDNEQKVNLELSRSRNKLAFIRDN